MIILTLQFIKVEPHSSKNNYKANTIKRKNNKEKTMNGEKLRKKEGTTLHTTTINKQETNT